MACFYVEKYLMFSYDNANVVYRGIDVFQKGGSRLFRLHLLLAIFFSFQNHLFLQNDHVFAFKVFAA